MALGASTEATERGEAKPRSKGGWREGSVPAEGSSGSAAGVLNCIATGGELVSGIGWLALFSASACAITAR
jgi:hypothetical protein